MKVLAVSQSMSNFCFVLIMDSYLHLFFSLPDNLGVSLYKDKGSADMINVQDCLEGKVKTVDVNVLAAKLVDLPFSL